MGVGVGDSHPASAGQKLPREGALARPAWRGLALGPGRPSSILPWPMAGCVTWGRWLASLSLFGTYDVGYPVRLGRTVLSIK